MSDGPRALTRADNTSQFVPVIGELSALSRKVM